MENRRIITCDNINMLKRLILVREYKSYMLKEAKELLKMAKCWEDPKELIPLSELLIKSIEELSETLTFPETLESLSTQVDSYIDYVENYRNSFEKETLKSISYNINGLKHYLSCLPEEEELNAEDYEERNSHLDWIENKA
ncbi:hypothetical protein [Vibrio parahaemolyticus]|uniref:hypothetical protein n=1 Tax=Vibrio harveyi group TaxID=717610 RepID=UPI0012FD6451|nr:hypothetical protein [Vibrio parahaemolyticus]EJG0638747.1 hypothetical protein [Vibrio parahaemolyticus]EJG1047507.1 hypothetical protein [Vibrio parahaemolyticus]EJG1080173.1 hypothetical protein [Vibrio parahaemolyticus]EJG1094107.1 hypothetical protein [Vibrio parahaemolyticus]EMC9388885.1 hypothetical protein [Vibrio parahaemolyticus]